MTEETALSKPIKMGINRKGIAANKQNFDNTMRDIDPLKVPNRLGLVIDDSGSMGREGMEKAHDAVRAFCQNCNPQDTSIAVYPLNAEKRPLICNYDAVTGYVNGVWATGGTPIYGTLDMLLSDSGITRAILFSDGSPTDGSCLKQDGYSIWREPGNWKDRVEKVFKSYNAKEVPIDTIFIGIKDSDGYKEMEEIAKRTGGTFLHFTDASVLAKSLKYLAPKFRALLANPEIKERIQRGESI